MSHAQKTLISKKRNPVILALIISGLIWFFFAEGIISDGFRKSLAEGLTIALLLGGFAVGMIWICLSLWMAKITLNTDSITYRTPWLKTKTVLLESIQTAEIHRVVINIFFRVTTCVVSYDLGGKKRTFGVSTMCFNKEDVLEVSKLLNAKSNV